MIAEPYPWDDVPEFADENDPDAVELYQGRRAPFSQLGDWVALSGASGQACKLYWVFVMHLNRSRGDGRVWPKRKTLARLMGFTKVASIDRYITELAGLKAIDVIPRFYKNGFQANNAYRVHETPPLGYAGPLSITDMYR